MAPSPSEGGLFREEALRHHLGARERGDVLRLAPSWTRWTYWLLLGVVLAGFAYSLLGSVRRYAEGPAVVQSGVDDGARATGEGYSVIVFLPGICRPALREGMSLRLEPSGYSHASSRATIVSIAEQGVGPSQARRLLGGEIAKGVEVPASAVLVRATLEGSTFRAGQEEFEYHEGMLAKAEVPLQSERIFFLLLPALKGAFAD